MRHARSSAKAARTTNRQGRQHDLFALVSELGEPLDQALALAGALELIGTGLVAIADNHGASLIAIAEAMTDQLTTAKTTWRRIIAASSPSRSRRRPGRG